MKRATMLICLSATLMCGAAALTTEVAAQQRQKVSIQSAAANTKYTQQLFLTLETRAGHQIRAFEIIGLIRPMLRWSTGSRSRLVDARHFGLRREQRHATTYGVFTMDNGDKFLSAQALWHRAAQRTGGTTSGVITGGRQARRRMKGLLRTVNKADPKAGTNEAQSEIEYWFEKWTSVRMATVVGRS